MKWFKKHWDILLIGAVIFYGCAFYIDRVVSKPQPNTATQQQCTANAQQLLTYINDERTKIGSPALVVDSQLAISSRQKLDGMVAQKYYGHNQLDGSSWSIYATNLGVKAKISEDLNINALTPEAIWASYKNSPSHYQSLTDPTFTRAGIATQCTNFKLEKATGPSDNSNLIGKQITDLTVVHLAAPEPVTPTPSQTVNCEYRFSELLGRAYSTCN